MKKTLLLVLSLLFVLVLGACSDDKKDDKQYEIKEEQKEDEKTKEEQTNETEATQLDRDMMDSWLSENKEFLDKQPTLGDEEAPLTILVFADYKCPYCAKWEEEILPDLKRELVDRGEAKIKFVNFPFIGPDSNTAAYAGESIYHQSEEAFWEYTKLMFENQKGEKKQWANKEFILDLAKDIDGIDLDKLEKDIEEKTYKDNVEEDRLFAMKSHINATPSIIINGYNFSNAFDMNTIFSFAYDFFEGQKESNDN